MPRATLTSKGQLTLPKALRERLRLDTGDWIDFTVDDGTEVRTGLEWFRVSRLGKWRVALRGGYARRPDNRVRAGGLRDIVRSIAEWTCAATVQLRRDADSDWPERIAEVVGHVGGQQERHLA